MVELTKDATGKICQASNRKVYGDRQVHPLLVPNAGHGNARRLRSYHDKGKRCERILFANFRRELIGQYGDPK